MLSCEDGHRRTFAGKPAPTLMLFLSGITIRAHRVSLNASNSDSLVDFADRIFPATLMRKTPILTSFATFIGRNAASPLPIAGGVNP
jgi:hypothetical protein